MRPRSCWLECDFIHTEFDGLLQPGNMWYADCSIMKKRLQKKLSGYTSFLLSIFGQTNNVAATTKSIWRRAHSYLNGRNYSFLLNEMRSLSAWNDICCKSVFSTLKQVKPKHYSVYTRERVPLRSLNRVQDWPKKDCWRQRLTGVTLSKSGQVNLTKDLKNSMMPL